MAEKRIDPDDGSAYTFDELASFYKGKFKKQAIQAYWDEQCTPAKKAKSKAKAKGKAAAEPEPKAKAKAKAKGKGKAEAKPEPKAKAKGKAKAEAKAKAKPEEAPKPSLGKPAAVGQYRSSKPVDISDLTRMSKDDLGLLPQPAKPKFKAALVGIYVRSAPFGGGDKSSNGHRYDSIPFANGMIAAGMSCQLIHYVHDEHDKFFDVAKSFDALVVRCNPGQIKADGGDQGKFDDGMRALRKEGIQVWPSPDVMEFMGAKDALCKIAHLNIGLEDTLAYYSAEEFAAGFKKTVAFQPRVMKQNRGSSGEGIWIIKLKSGEYCKTYGEKSCSDDDVLDMMEANDNHAEEHTVAEFIEFCVNGRTSKSGEWTSKGVGKYLEGGKAAGGQLVDQRFCPRIVEGELRFNMVGDELTGIIHKKPAEGGISAVGGTGSIYTFYQPRTKKFASLVKNYITLDLPKVMPSLGLEGEPIPLWWTTDFINSSPVGTPEKDEKWIVGEFNCSCVGISKCLPAYCKEDTPEACYNDIPKKDLSEVKRLGSLVGKKALSVLYKNKAGPKYTIGYWNIRGLAAPMRMMLEYAGAEYKDEQYDVVKKPDGTWDKSSWFEGGKPPLLKKNALMNLPYVISGGRVVTQSTAAYVFLGQKLRLNGVGSDAVTANNEVIAQAFDLRNATVGTMYGPTDDFPATGKKFLSETVTAHFTKFENYLAQRGTAFFAGNKPCVGDFALWEMCDQQELLAKELKVASPLESYPGLKAFYEKFKALPQLKKYFESDAYKLPVNNKMAHFK